MKMITVSLMAVALAMTAAIAVFAHEDEEEEGYRLTVGFLYEPAYEGERNAVSIRVVEVVAEEETAPQGHHGGMALDVNQSGAAFASQTLSSGDSFEFEVPDALAGMTVPFYGSPNANMTGVIRVEEGDDHHAMSATQDMSGEHAHGPLELDEPVSVQIDADVEDHGEVNVRLMTNGFTWSPQNVNQYHVPGEGHAHIYVDGVKLGRMYGPSYHLPSLEPGERHIRVTLNSNDHSELAFEGKPVEATRAVSIPASSHRHDHSHGPNDPVESDTPMSLELVAHPDTGTAYNIQAIPTGFEFSGENVNGEHVQGEGYGQLYIDGEKITRMYAPWFQVSDLSPGMHTVRVSLNTNQHNPYSWNDEPVEGSVTVHVEAKEDSGHDHDMAERIEVSIEDDAFHPAEVSATPGATIVFVNDSAGDLRILSGDSGSDAMGMSDSDRSESKTAAPVVGLQDTLQVEVTHVPSGTSRIMPLRAAYNDPGHYVADLIPTSPGHYRFRFFGAIEGEPVDTTFDSMAGGGGFDDVQAASVIHFPDTVASAREVESAVRGAQTAAQQAQADAISAKDSASGASTIGIIGIIVGAVGVLFGGGAMFMSLRRRG